jgi:hypothetical protein
VTTPPATVVAQQQPTQPDDAYRLQPLLPPPPTVELREVDRWYGGFTLMADGLSLGAAIAGGITEGSGGDGEPFFWIAGGGYLFGAPIVHLVHENPGRAALSFGMRVALPLAFFGTGLIIEDCPRGDFCGLASFVIGVPLGMATAIALDASLVARDTVKESFSIAPTAMLTRDGASIGVIGTF